MVSVRVAFCVVALVVVAEAARVTRQKAFDTKYDDIDLDNVLRSDRLLQNYVNCLLDKGKCTPDGQLLKTSIPDALTNDCAQCSEKQKVGSDKVLSFLLKNKPAVWDELEAKYDPSGSYKKKYEARLKTLTA